MSCPNCGQVMLTVNYDKQDILHCENCGGTFFEENAINRISQTNAFHLANEKKTDEISGEKKFCPKDKTVLEILPHTEAIPSNVTLLRCTTCHGIFAFPDDLINFKKAQDAKVSYFATWNIPLDTIKAVVVLTFVAFFSALFFTVYVYNQSPQSMAQDVIKRVYVTRSGPNVFFSFQTVVPVSSGIIFQDKTKNVTLPEKPVDNRNDFVTFHELTVTGLNLQDDLYYQISATDKLGRVIKTSFQKLAFTP